MSYDVVQFRVELTGKEQIDELKAFAKQYRENTINYKIKMVNLKSQIHEADKEMRKISEDREIAFKAKIAPLEKAISDAKAQVDELTKEKEVKLELRRGITKQISEVKADLESIAKKKLDVQVNLKYDREGGYDALVADIKSAQSFYKKLQSEGASKDVLRAQMKEINTLQAQRLAVESNFGEVNAKARELMKQLSELTEQKWRVKAEIEGLDEQIKEADKKLQALQEELKIKVGIEAEETKKELDVVAKKRQELVDQKTELQLKFDADTAQMDIVNDRLKEMDANARAVADTFKGIGDALQFGGSGIKNIGKMLQSANDFFGGNFVSALESRIRRSLARGVISSFGDAVKRYDVFNQFPQIMGVLGFGDQAGDIVEELNQSVQGLPTTLDEIVASAQEFIMLTNDPQKGKNLAISLNNALLSSGRDEAWQQNARDQIVNILTGGDLGDDQWRSMFRGLGVSLAYIGEEFGYSTNEVDKFQKALLDGEIASEDFVNALINAGQKGGIKELTEISTDLLQSSLKNLRTAVVNAEASMLQEVDKILTDYTGKTLVGNIVAVSDAIKQKLIPQMRDWFRAHPEAITNFFDRLANYDWFGLLSKIGKGAVEYFDFMSKLYTAIPGGIVGWILTKGNLVGKILDTIGSGISTVGKALKSIGEALAVGKLFSFAKKGGIGGVIGKVFGAGEGSLGWNAIGMSAATIGTFLGSAAAIGGVLYEFAVVFQKIGEMDFGNFDQNVGKFSGLAAEIFGATGLMTALFGWISTTPLAPAVVGGELLTVGFSTAVASITEAMGSIVDIIDQIATLPETLENMSKDMTSSNIKKWGDNIGKMIDVISQTFNGIFDALDRNNNGFLLGELYSSEKQKRILSNLEESIGNVSKIAETFTNLRLSFEPLFRSRPHPNGVEGDTYSWLNALRDEFPVFVGKIGEMFDEMYTALDRNNNKVYFLEESTQAKELKKLLENIESAIGNVKKISETMMKLEEDMSHWNSYRPLYGANNLQAMKVNFANLMSGIGDMFSAMVDAGEAGGEESLYWQLKKSEQVAPLMENISSALTSIGDIVTNMNDIKYKLRGMFTKRKVGEAANGHALYSNSMKETLDYVSKFLFGDGKSEGLSTFMNKLIKEMHNLYTVGDTGAGDVTEELATVYESMQKTMGSVAMIVGSLNRLYENYGDSIGGTGDTGLQLFLANLKRFIGSEQTQTGLYAVFKAFSDISTLPGMDSSGSIIDTAVIVVEKIGGMMEKLKELQTTYGGDDTTLSFGETLGATIGGLTAALAGLGGDAGLVSALDDVIGALDNTKKSSNNLKDAIQQLQDKISEFDTSNAQGQLESLMGTMSAVQVAAFLAYGAVSSLASAINRLQSKTITLTVNRQGDWSRPPGFATGGMIYRASGGSIFKPRGTDTVPAMLTPGEYVMKRSAVNTFGAKFMQKVNNLDIDGAFRSLMVRAGSGLISRTMSNVTNNYRDNHSTVNIYGKEGRRGMDYRRAGRYVRAL